MEGAGVVLAGRREGFHGDPAGSAIPGVQITPSRAVRASRDWQEGDKVLPSF